MATKLCLTLAASALLLGACTSARMGGYAPIAAVRGPNMSTVLPQPEPVEAVPSGSVLAEPLPPLDGGGPPPSSEPMDVASLPPTDSPVVVPVAPSGRAAVVGGWTARDAAGATCRVQLSSTPALDLYRASSSGCSNADLSGVTGWDYREGEVYLYQRGGAVAARLRVAGGSLDGVLAKSGAPLTLQR